MIKITNILKNKYISAFLGLILIMYFPEVYNKNKDSTDHTDEFDYKKEEVD